MTGAIDVPPALTARAPQLQATEPSRLLRPSAAASTAGRGYADSSALAALCTCSTGVGFLAAQRRRRGQRLCSVAALSNYAAEEPSYDRIAKELCALTDKPLKSLINSSHTLVCPRCGDHQRGDRTLMVQVKEGSVFYCRCFGTCQFAGNLHQGEQATPSAASPTMFKAVSSTSSGMIQESDEAGFAEDIEQQLIRRTRMSVEELAYRGSAWVNGLVCPACRGGQKHERNFGVKVDRDAGGRVCIGYRCLRQNKCGIHGRVRIGSAGSGDASACFPMAARSAPGIWGEDVELDAQFREYLTQVRMIPEKVLQRNKVCQKKGKGHQADAINFRYFAGEELVAEKLRTLDKNFKMGVVGQCLYGVDDILGADVIVLTEGEMDKLSVEAAGIQAVASLQNGCGGGLAMGHGAKEALDGATRIVLALDADEGGSKATEELGKMFGYAKCYQVNWPEGCKDSNEVLCKFGPAELQSLIESATRMRPPHVASFDTSVQRIVADRINGNIPQEFISGVQTGWSGIDRFYRPVRGEVTVVTGIPGSGKSEWLLSLAMNLAESRGWRFLLYTFETDDKFLSVQLLEKKFRKPYTELYEHVDSGLDWLDRHFARGCVGYESPTIEEILKMAEVEATSEEGLHGLIIDPYNFIHRDEEEQETHFIGTLIGKLRSFAEKHKVHVWICAHPTKSTAWDGERPNMYNIAGSANWFNKTDNGIIVHRKRIEVEGEMMPTRTTEIVVEKVRNKEAGTLGSSFLLFDKDRRGYECLPQSHDDGDYPQAARKTLIGHLASEGSGTAE
eukprot:gb/GFBE01036692.1/.p1 GENE.gb/GFBE01036692.1/~~gb/GFBE01036692.1/.p1  ORF type:complete len:789 (+),score=157.66 gb/GFBE01036692.1/:1-2367(+)